MIIPEQCKKYIRLQRSECRKDPIKDFEEKMKEEFNQMLPFVPRGVKQILDIGCGLGGLDVLLAGLPSRPHIYCMDSRTESHKIRYGFEINKECYYNSFDCTADLFIANGYGSESATLIDITEKGVVKDKSLDMVMSTLSWGYHYPVSEYLDFVDRVLKPHGVVILDIRETTLGREDMQRCFSEAFVIAKQNKSYRMLYRRGKKQRGE